MFRNAIKPGTEVPTSGAYWVHHYQHRVSHLVALRQGELFPRCHKCEDRVRFELSIDGSGAPHFSADPDFRSTSRDSSTLQGASG